MKKYFPVLTVLALLVFASPAFAWNCTNSKSQHVDVGTTKPSGSQGLGDGQWFLGTGSEGIKGHYYVCVPPTPPTPPTTPSTPVTQTQNQNQTQNQSQTQNSTSNSASNSSSTSKSNSTASVNGSGNSSNTNNNTANGGAGGAGGTGVGGNQSQESNSSASNNGNGANNSSYESNTTVEASKIPVSTAIGVAPPSNLNCAIGYGGGVQTAGLGISGAFSRVDKNCARLTVALTARNRISYCKIYITNKYAKEAHVTLEDCMLEEKREIVAAPVSVPVQPQPQIIIIPAPVQPAVTPVATIEPTPAIVAKTSQKINIGECRMTGGILNNQCRRFLDDAALRLNNNPNTRLLVTGPPEASKAVVYLQNKVDPSRIGVPSFTDEANYHLVLQLEISE